LAKTGVLINSEKLNIITQALQVTKQNKHLCVLMVGKNTASTA